MISKKENPKILGNKSDSDSDSDSYTFLDRSKMVISGICYETYPCMHDVIIDSKLLCYDGIKIANYFQVRNEKVPEHFQCYIETSPKKRKSI